MAHQLVLVLDFGSQYTQLIARRIREQRVYCEIHPYTLPLEPAKLRALAPDRDRAVRRPDRRCTSRARRPSPAAVFDLGVPVLGICYGAQLTARLLGGEVSPAERREYGRASVARARRGRRPRRVRRPGCRRGAGGVGVARRPRRRAARRASSHTARERQLQVLAGSPNAARRIHCVQFHPEVVPHAARRRAARQLPVRRVPGHGRLVDGERSSTRPSRRSARRSAPSGAVICGLSGGVDSCVAAALIHTRDRRPADLHLRRQRPAAQGRARLRRDRSSAITSRSTCA